MSCFANVLALLYIVQLAKIRLEMKLHSLYSRRNQEIVKVKEKDIMNEEFYRKRVAELISKADKQQIREIYFFLLGMLGGAVYERD